MKVEVVSQITYCVDDLREMLKYRDGTGALLPLPEDAEVSIQDGQVVARMVNSLTRPVEQALDDRAQEPSTVEAKVSADLVYDWKGFHQAMVGEARGKIAGPDAYEIMGAVALKGEAVHDQRG